MKIEPTYNQELLDFVLEDWNYPRGKMSLEELRSTYRKILTDGVHYNSESLRYHGIQILHAFFRTKEKLPSFTQLVLSKLPEGESVDVSSLGPTPTTSMRQQASIAGIRLSIVTLPNKYLRITHTKASRNPEQPPATYDAFAQPVPVSALDALDLPPLRQTQEESRELNIARFLSLCYEMNPPQAARTLARILPNAEEVSVLPPLTACVVSGNTTDPDYRRIRRKAELEGGKVQLLHRAHAKIAVNTETDYDLEFTFDQNGIHTKAVYGLHSKDPTLHALNRISHTELICHALDTYQIGLYIYLEFVASKESILLEQPKELMPAEFRGKLQRRLPKGIRWIKGVKC